MEQFGPGHSRVYLLVTTYITEGTSLINQRFKFVSDAWTLHLFKEKKPQN